MSEEKDVYHIYAPQDETADTETDRAIADRHGNVIDEAYSTIEDLNTKQDNLVSGENIKTINGESILGSGNLAIKDCVQIFASRGDFPSVGSPAIIYIAQDTDKQYAWDNGEYVELSKEDEMERVYVNNSTLIAATLTPEQIKKAHEGKLILYEGMEHSFYSIGKNSFESDIHITNASYLGRNLLPSGAHIGGMTASFSDTTGQVLLSSNHNANEYVVPLVQDNFFDASVSPTSNGKKLVREMNIAGKIAPSYTIDDASKILKVNSDGTALIFAEDASSIVANNFASEFITGTIYRQGSYCIHENVLYQKTYDGGSGLEESWDPSHWEHIIVMDKVKPLEEKIDKKIEIIDIAYNTVDSVLLGSLPSYCILNYDSGSQYTKFIFTSDYQYRGTYEYTMKSDSIKYHVRGTGLGSYPLSYLMSASNREYLSTRQMQNITWSELKSLRDNSILVPGVQYRIIDYDCTTTEAYTQSAGHPFDIIVTADTVDRLNENARACLHDGDTYFVNNNLSAWQIWYCLDNDGTRFSWADANSITISGTTYLRCIAYDDMSAETYKYAWKGTSLVFTETRWPFANVTPAYTNSSGTGNALTISAVHTSSGTGVIYRMIDEFNNDIPYDFKNIQYIHDKTLFVHVSAGPGYDTDFVRDSSSDITGFYAWRAQYASYGGPSVVYTNVESPTYGTTLYQSNGSVSTIARIVSVSLDEYDAYTFNTESSGSYVDMSLYGNRVHDNHIDAYYDDYGYKTKLNKTIFKLTNTGSSCHSNMIGTYNHDNLFSGTIITCNNISTYFYRNDITGNFSYNTIGQSCQNNSIKAGCQRNQIDAGFSQNKIDSNFTNNVVAVGFSANTVRQDFSYNTIGPNFYANTVGMGFYSNEIGPRFHDNIVGSSFTKNDVGPDFSNNLLDVYYTRYCTFDSGVQFISLTSTQPASTSDFIQNIHIHSGIAGTSSSRKVVDTIRSSTYSIDYYASGSQSITLD